MGQFALNLLKWVVPVLALLAMLAGAYKYGESDGMISRQGEIDVAVRARVQAETDVAVLRGQVEAYKEAGDKVDAIRQMLSAQNELLSAKLTARINVVGQLLLARTGDECKDARNVANAYFDQLDKEKGK